ncbi:MULTISPECIES: hypothetical protein [Rhodopseudomonas]|uniref:hypothetical protein n=1 Tax=Rhodopseudomonas TaxID=1073 RepID=UPI000DF2A67C|nr:MULTISPECIES: hypothetical protein [Rhodopseudomonas]
MTEDQVSDSVVKEFLASWPDQFSVDGKKWLCMRKKREDSMPYLYVPGSRQFGTQPDALYGHFGLDPECNEIEFADLIAIEACNTDQNLFDKRSRYVDQNRLGVFCQEKWLKRKKVEIGNNDCGLQNIPVRFQSILYILPDALFERLRQHLHPWGNEYFLPLSRRSEEFSSMFKHMVPQSHFFGCEYELVLDV